VSGAGHEREAASYLNIDEIFDSFGTPFTASCARLNRFSYPINYEIVICFPFREIVESMSKRQLEFIEPVD
jgi:hypothetical protein